MNAREKRLLVLASAAGVAALAIAIALSRSVIVRGDGVRSVASQASDPGEAPALVTVATVETRSALGEPERPELVAPSGAPGGAPAYFPSPTVLLRGRVKGCVGEVWRTELRVTLPGTHQQRSQGLSVGSPDAHGEFELDVTPLFLFDRRLEWVPDRLVLDASHEENLPGRTLVAMEIDGRALDLAAFHERSVTVVQADVDLLPAGWIVGKVRTSEGALGGVRVSVFPLVDGTPGEAIGEGWTRLDGIFRVRVAPAARLVAAACAPGFLPASALTGMRLPMEVEVGELVLTRGVSIAGRAQLGTSQASGATVGAFRSAISAVPTANRCGPFQWSGASFATLSASAVAGADGTFEIAGLSPGEYEVRIVAAPDALVQMTRGVRVLAPASGVELGSTLGLVRLELVADGQPVQRTIELIEQGDLGFVPRSLGFHATDAQGKVAFWLPLDRLYAIPLPGEREFGFRSPRGAGEQTLRVEL